MIWPCPLCGGFCQTWAPIPRLEWVGGVLVKVQPMPCRYLHVVPFVVVFALGLP